MTSLLKLPKPMNSKFRSLDQFSILKQIGDGAFSKVFAVTDVESQLQYALKVIDLAGLKPTDYANIENEVKIHSILQSQYIIKMHGFFADRTKVFLVLDLETNGNLYKRIRTRPLDEYMVKKCFRQVCQGPNWDKKYNNYLTTCPYNDIID